MAVHFVGVSGRSFVNAVKVWGHPDFWHKWHDNRMYGDVDADNDVIVFGQKQDPKKTKKYSWQDSSER